MSGKAANRIFRTASLMVAATVFSKFLALLRDILIAKNYGTGFEAQAYEAASKLPILFFDFVIGGVVTAAFIPIFNTLLVKENREKALEFANTYVNFILLLTLIVAALGIAFSPALVSYIAPDIESQTLAVSLSRIMFPMIIFTGLAFSFVGILQSFGEFNIPSIISLVSNLALVLYFVFLNDTFGIYGLSVTLVIGWALQAAVQIPKVRSFGYRYKPTLKVFTPEIKEAVLMGLPILVCTWLQPVTSLICSRFASGISGGSGINAVGYANRFYTIIVGVFSFVASNLLFPYLSKAEASGDSEEARKFGRTSVKTLLLIIFPIAAGLFVLSEPIVKLVYMRGEFSADDAALTAAALRYFAFGMPAMAANEIFLKVFFSKKITVPPMLASLASIAVNYIAVMLMSGVMGIRGIALSASIAITVCAAANFILLARRGTAILGKGDIPDLVKNALYSVIMAVACYFLYGALLPYGYILSMVISIIIGFLIYSALNSVLPTNELGAIMKRGRND